MMVRPRLRRYPGPGLTASVLDMQVGAGADDGYSRDDGQFQPALGDIWLGRHAAGSTQAWARFTNVTIPAGATITAAYITVQVEDSSQDGSGMRTDLFFEDHDDADAPTSQADHAGKARTTAFTAWDDEDFVVDTDTDSPDIAAAVQEVIDRGGWNSGQALQLLWDDGVSGVNKYYRPYPFEDTAAKAIKLHVEYLA